MTFARVAVALAAAIAALQVLLWTTPARQVTVVLPLRPSLLREADALTIADEGAPPDLAEALASMDRVPSLALTASQREALLGAIRREDERAPGGAGAFRAKFMRATEQLLDTLTPDQVRFIAEHHEEFNLEFEASYWHTLRERLSSSL